MKVIDQLTADYKALDAANAAYYDQRSVTFKDEALREYTGLIGDIQAKYAGTPVGITEPVFGYMAQALGLKVLTPETFIKAIDEGEDPGGQHRQPDTRRRTQPGHSSDREPEEDGEPGDRAEQRGFGKGHRRENRSIRAP